MSANRADRMDRLFDLAAARADGFTVDEAAAYLDCSVALTNDAIRDLRDWLAQEADTINLVCDPEGQGQRWSYKLVGTVEEAETWTANRLRDGERRLVTIQSVAACMVNATDGRSTKGRKVRLISAVLASLLAQLRALDGEAS